MAEEIEEPKLQPLAGEEEQIKQEEKSGDGAAPNFSINIWPPSKRTRDAVINRLVETLSSSNSVLSKRYPTIPKDEASDAARGIEGAAFTTASDAAGEDPGIAGTVDGGIEILQIYSKEISRRMLDFVKAKGPAPPAAPLTDSTVATVEMTTPSAPAAPSSPSAPTAPSAPASEEVSSVEAEALAS